MCLLCLQAAEEIERSAKQFLQVDTAYLRSIMSHTADFELTSADWLEFVASHTDCLLLPLFFGSLSRPVDDNRLKLYHFSAYDLKSWARDIYNRV